jgi:hypothetical protein
MERKAFNLTPTVELAKECMRLSENCLYTSTSFFIWLRYAREVRAGFVTLPIVFGAAAVSSLFVDCPVLTGALSLVAGVLPLLQAALKWDTSVDDLAQVAGEYKNLQDRFRRATLISSLGPYEAFKAETDLLMERLEQLRLKSITPPEWCFRRAQKKIGAGHYTFDFDEQVVAAASGPTGATSSLGPQRTP